MKVNLNEIKKIVRDVLSEQVEDDENPTRHLSLEDQYSMAVEQLTEAAKEIDFEMEIEKGDDGIGYYEYGSQKGFDSQPYATGYVNGQETLAWWGDFDIDDTIEVSVEVDAVNVDVRLNMMPGTRKYNAELGESYAIFSWDETVDVSHLFGNTYYD